MALRDRAGIEHPVDADVGCRNTVFHGAPQSAASLVPALVKSGVQRFRIELVRERGSEVGPLIQIYRALVTGRSSPAKVWHELRASRAAAGAGYGVVRGSLRVLP